MKIRSSAWMIPILTAMMALVGPLSKLSEPSWDMGLDGMAVISGGAMAFGLVLGTIIVLFVETYVYPGIGLGDKAKDGKFNARRVIEEGERFVIANNTLKVQRADGTLENLRYRKWACNKRDWAQLEQALPVLDVR